MSEEKAEFRVHCSTCEQEFWREEGEEQDAERLQRALEHKCLKGQKKVLHGFEYVVGGS